MVVGEVEHGVPQAVEGHEPRGHEKQLFQGRFVVDRVLRERERKKETGGKFNKKNKDINSIKGLYAKEQ